jgi:hypothetical protein
VNTDEIREHARQYARESRIAQGLPPTVDRAANPDEFARVVGALRDLDAAKAARDLNVAREQAAREAAA